MDVSLMKNSRDCMVIQNGKYPGMAQMNPMIRENEVHGPWVEGNNSSLGSLFYYIAGKSLIQGVCMYYICS